MADFFTLTEEQEKRAAQLHKDSIIVDGLVFLAETPKDDSYLKTLIASGITVSNFTVHHLTDDFNMTARRIADWYVSLEKFPDLFKLVRDVKDIRDAKENGQTGIILGFQDTKAIENELQLIRVFYELGVRVFEPTYQYRNHTGGSCFDGENDPGLSAFGHELVKRLDELGILIDLSHVGPKTSLDTIKASSRPCAFTHACAADLCAHVRNKSDELIQAIAEKGGMIGMVAYSQFLDIHGTREVTINEFLDVIDHIVEISSVDAVGLAFDYTPNWGKAEYEFAQGYFPEIYLDYPYEITRPKGLEDITKCIDVTRGLVGRGYSDEDVRKILGGNFMRVFEGAWS